MSVEDKIVITNKDEVDENQSGIRHLSKKYDELKKELKEKNLIIAENPTKEDFNAMQEQVKTLTDTNIENTYGKEHVEEARNLIKAGFQPNRIKEMLGLNTELNIEPKNTNDELGLVPQNGKVIIPELSKEEQDETNLELKKEKEFLDSIEKAK